MVPSPELTVVTQNLWGAAPRWPRRRDRLIGQLADLQPDLIGLQEVHSADGVRSQAHELADRLGGLKVLYAPTRTGPEGRSEGVALLSRNDLIESSAERLSLDPSDPLDRSHPRVILRALVESHGERLDVFVTHLSLSRRARARSFLELRSFADRTIRASGSRGALLMGDLNAEPDEPALASLRAASGPDDPGWLDAWEVSQGPRSRGGTWPAPLPFRRIDYLLVRSASAWIVADCDRLSGNGSDHLGLTARFRPHFEESGPPIV